MTNKLPKIITISFLLIFAIQLAGLIFLFVAPEPSLAADAKFIPQVTIGDFEAGDEKTPSIANYVKAIYTYAIGIVGILAAVVLMFGGILWITAGGNNERIGNAKSWIAASLSGLVLSLCSYMILYTINPGLIEFTDITAEDISEIKTVCCEYKLSDGHNYASLITTTNCSNKNGTPYTDYIPNSTNSKCIKDENIGCCVIRYQTGTIFKTDHCICYQNIKQNECSSSNSFFNIDGNAKNITYNPDNRNNGSCNYYTQAPVNCNLKN